MKDAGLKLIVMGVSGCGKSTFGASLARATGAEFIEGDVHHLASSADKMRRGISLNDADREPWLDRLASLLEERPGSAVLSCSALKKSYRDRLRAGVPGLQFVFLQISPGAATERVGSRSGHAFPVSLVANQFEALQSPAAETGVLVIDAEQPAVDQLHRALAWLRRTSGFGSMA